MTLQPARRPQPCLQPPVICLDRVVRVLLNGAGPREPIPRALTGGRARRSVVTPARTAPTHSAREKNRRKTARSRLAASMTSMTWPCWSTARVEISPLPSDLYAGLVDEPPVPGRMAVWPGCLGELQGEPLHPPEDADVINGDAALGQQFLNVPVGQAVPEVLADRERYHLGREPEAAKDQGRARQSHRISLPPYATDQRNSALRRVPSRRAGLSRSGRP
jgi:hypothetical protein